MLFSGGCASRDNDSGKGSGLIPEEALTDLDRIISRADSFNQAKTRHLDSLKGRLPHITNATAHWQMLINIAKEYRQMNADSSIIYGRLAMRELPANASGQQRALSMLTLVNALSTAGLFSSASEDIDAIKTHCIDTASKIEYWKTCRILYSYMDAYATGDHDYANQLRNKYIECDDSLMALLPEDNPFRQFIDSERMIGNGQLATAKQKLLHLINVNQKNSNIFGMSAYQLAQIYRREGNYHDYATTLSLAAQSDIMGCVKEGLALPELADWLYLHGDLDNAFNYINFSLEEANSGNMRMRTVTITSSMPIIDRSYRKKINDSNDLKSAFLIWSLFLLVLACILSALLFKTMRKMHRKERYLASTSKMLEAYVGNFIGLCSNYAARLEQFSKLVTRKVKAGQADDLLKLMNAGKYAEEDNEEFYQLIDKAILDIFPHFVENINDLLEPDKQVVLKPGELLNPELRIYAFVRLGVDQSSKIAQILNYSINTVYAYRNRMRNRAKDRDNFDNDVAKLGKEDSTLPILISSN